MNKSGKSGELDFSTFINVCLSLPSFWEEVEATQKRLEQEKPSTVQK